MNYEQLEDDVLARLQARLNGSLYAMAIMPDVDPQMQPNLQKPKVWIAYSGSTFDQVNRTPKMIATGPTVQQEVVNIELTFQGTKRRGDGQLYDLIRATKKALLGYSTSQAGKFYMIDARPFDHVQNLWDYKLIIGAMAHIVQEVDEELDAIPDVTNVDVTRITLDNEDFNDQLIIPEQP